MDKIGETELREIDSLAERAYALRFVDARAALHCAGSALRRAERVGYRRGVAQARLASGAAQGWLADLAPAEADLAAALEIFRADADVVGEARTLFWQAMIARRRADYSTAMRLAADALALFWSAGDRPGEADALRMIGSLYALGGDFVSALERFDESRQISEDLGCRQGVALCANDSAVALFELGDHESARQVQEEALAQFRRAGAISASLPTLSNLGITYSELGHHDRGLELLQECITLCRQSGERLPRARALYNLGRVRLALSDPEGALEHFTAAEELSRALGERRTEIGAAIGAGRALVLLGDTVSAVEKLTAALAAAERSEIKRVLGEAHQALAEAYEAMGDLGAAIRHLKVYQDLREEVQRAGATLRMQHRSSVAELERTQQETELRVLKAQLQPHFLFNALHSLAILIERRPADAARMVLHLGDLLSMALKQSSEQHTTLQGEIDFAVAYLKMEQVRHRDLFDYTVDVEPTLGCTRVPHLILQPLVENSIRHGFARANGGARIEIRAHRTATDRLRLSIADNGVGLSCAGSSVQGGVGLRNTRLRLLHLYGPDHQFILGPKPGGGTLVEIDLPLAH